MNVEREMIPGRAKEVFEIWKQIMKKKRDVPIVFRSTDKERLTDDELLRRTATILKTQPEHVLKTLKRFLDELKITEKT